MKHPKRPLIPLANLFDVNGDLEPFSLHRIRHCTELLREELKLRRELGKTQPDPVRAKGYAQNLKVLTALADNLENKLSEAIDAGDLEREDLPEAQRDRVHSLAREARLLLLATREHLRLLRKAYALTSGKP